METTKAKRIDLRASKIDEQNIQKAAEKLGTNKISETIFNSVKQVAEKVEFGCDRPAIHDTSANVEYCLTHIQSFVNVFKALTGSILARDECENVLIGVGKSGSTEILQNAITELITEKLYQKLINENPAWTMTLDNIKQPDLSKLFELSDLLDNAPRIKMNFVGVYWHMYKISETGEVSIDQVQLDRMTDNYRFVASSPDELKKLSVVQTLCEALNNIMLDPEIDQNRIFSLVYFDSELKRFSPSGSYIKMNHRPPILFERYSK